MFAQRFGDAKPLALVLARADGDRVGIGDRAFVLAEDDDHVDLRLVRLLGAGRGGQAKTKDQGAKRGMDRTHRRTPESSGSDIGTRALNIR